MLAPMDVVMCCHHCLLRRLTPGGNTLASVLLALAHLAKRTRRLGVSAAPRRLSSTSCGSNTHLVVADQSTLETPAAKKLSALREHLQHLQHLVDPRRGDVVRARAHDETTTGDDGLILKSGTRARTASVCGFRDRGHLRLHKVGLAKASVNPVASVVLRPCFDLHASRA